MSFASQSSADVQDRLGRRRDLGDRLALGQVFGRAADDLDQLLDRDREVGEEVARLEKEAVAQGGEVLLGELGREDLPRAVGQVVGLVDQEDRLARARRRSGGAAPPPARRRSCSRPRSRRRAAASSSWTSNGQTSSRRASSKTVSGSTCGMILAEALEQVRTSPSSAGSPSRTGRTPRGRGSGRSRTSAPWRAPGRCGTRRVVHRDEGRDRHLLLQRLRRQEHDLAAGGEAFGEGGVEGGRGLAGARRRLGDQVLARGDGVADRGDQLLLDRPGRGMGEGQSLGGLGLAAPRRPGRARQIASARASRRSMSRSASSSKGTSSESSSPVSMST